MARTKFNRITIEYGGVDLLAGGWLADADGALNGSTQYTTSAVQSVGADAVALDENGNVERAREMSIAVDYESEADMLADVIAREGFADAHQRAVLRVCAREGQDAKAVFTPLEGYEAGTEYKLSIMEDGEEVNSWAWDAQDGDTVQDLLAALNDDNGQFWYNTRGIEATLEDGKVVLRRLDVHGDASNGYVVRPYANTPFAEGEDTPIAGGVDEVAQAYDAALSGLDYSSSVAGRGLRVVYRYGFILGGAADV